MTDVLRGAATRAATCLSPLPLPPTGVHPAPATGERRVSDQPRDQPANAFLDTADRPVAIGTSPVPIARDAKEPPRAFPWGQYTTRLPDASERYELWVAQGHQIGATPG